MTLSELVALAAVVLSGETNVALYVNLSSTMNSRFDSVDRKFESAERRIAMIQGSTHDMGRVSGLPDSKPGNKPTTPSKISYNSEDGSSSLPIN
jgi:hypothetical protein